MGWLFKGLVLAVGLVSLTLGFWPLWVPCFGYLAYSLWSATRRRSVYVVANDGEGSSPHRETRLWVFRKRYLLAGLLFLLAILAAREGGRLSPYALFSLAIFTSLSGSLPPGLLRRGLRPVPGTILLRSGWLPFRWWSLVEVKFATSRVSRALSSSGCEMLLAVDADRVSVYLPIGVTAFSEAQADRRIVERLAPIARSLSASGAYVLPMDEKESASRLAWSLRPVKLPLGRGRNGVAALGSAPFDVIVLRPEGHRLTRAAGYVKVSGPGKRMANLPSAGLKLRSQPLVWEALEALSERLQPPEADAYTSFLSSVCATRGEGLGERLVNDGTEGQSTMLLSSLGTTQVRLTRSQLRAIVGAYG